MCCCSIHITVTVTNSPFPASHTQHFTPHTLSHSFACSLSPSLALSQTICNLSQPRRVWVKAWWCLRQRRRGQEGASGRGRGLLHRLQIDIVRHDRVAHKALYYVRLPASNSPRPHSCTPHTVVALLGSQPDAAAAAAAAVAVNVAAPFCTLTPAVDFVLVFCGENFHLLSLTSLLSLPVSPSLFPLYSLPFASNLRCYQSGNSNKENNCQ